MPVTGSKSLSEQTCACIDRSFRSDKLNIYHISLVKDGVGFFPSKTIPKICMYYKMDLNLNWDCLGRVNWYYSKISQYLFNYL